MFANTEINKDYLNAVAAEPEASTRQGDGEENLSGFIVKIAKTREEREAVFRLGYDVYLQKGFVVENDQKWLISEYDSDTKTVLLMVCDSCDRLVGTVSLVFDYADPLPADAIYPNELSALRENFRGVVEISRFVVKHEYRNSKDVLLLLFNYLALYLRHVHASPCIVIEVNPRHRTYYKKLLGFEEVGVEKKCSQVLNAPAVLLFVAVENYPAEVKKYEVSGNSAIQSKSLYSKFMPLEQETEVCKKLVMEHKEISEEDRLYFGMPVVELAF